MAEPSRNIEVKKLISYTDDLVKVLVEPRDLNNLSYSLQQNLSLSSSSHSHFHHVRSSLQGLCPIPFFHHPFRYLSVSGVSTHMGIAKGLKIVAWFHCENFARNCNTYMLSFAMSGSS